MWTPRTTGCGWQKICTLMLMKVYTYEELTFAVMFLKNKFWGQYSTKIVLLFVNLSCYWSPMNVIVHFNEMELSRWATHFQCNDWPFLRIDIHWLMATEKPRLKSLWLFFGGGGALKKKVFKSTLENSDELKQKIMTEIRHITQVTWKMSSKNLFCHVLICKTQSDTHSQHLGTLTFNEI